MKRLILFLLNKKKRKKMKIVKGIEMQISVENKDAFLDYLAGQEAIKNATHFHSATFDEKSKKATVVYLNDKTDQGIVRGQKIVEVYVSE